MKNIESLAVKTKVKMQDKFIKERDTIEEERKHAHHRSNGQGNTHQRPTHIEKGVVHERQNDYFKVEYSKNDVPADHGARNRQRLNQNEAPVHSSQIDPKLYDNPNADKEVLNLVESQFGQGFLDLNFEDDEPEQHTKKPLSNPGNKNRQDDQFDFGGPKSVKQPKSKQSKRLSKNSKVRVR